MRDVGGIKSEQEKIKLLQKIARGYAQYRAGSAPGRHAYVRGMHLNLQLVIDAFTAPVAADWLSKIK
ncbi:hypothetical protein [Raoultella terrigena]|uniref:hypothetical protein n=1 Tax=Raoultella terrigena TaxID=577 RepID=UPI00349F08DB